MSLRSATRLCLAMIFLLTQLSLSWASAMPSAGDSHCAHAGHEMDMATGCIADDPANDGHEHDGHLDHDCGSECQMCTIALPVADRPLAVAPVAAEAAFKWQPLPPGMSTHPYRPPASS